MPERDGDLTPCFGALWHVFFDQEGVPEMQTSDGRMAYWLKTKKGVSGKDINHLFNKWRGQL